MLLPSLVYNNTSAPFLIHCSFKGLTTAPLTFDYLKALDYVTILYDLQKITGKR